MIKNGMNNRTRTKSFNNKFDGHGNGTQRLNVVAAVNSEDKYYAGAKFESIPSLTDLPVPPSHWTGDGRSQSTPSSPITISDKVPTSAKSYGGSFPCDTHRLFKSASLPGESNMENFKKSKKESHLSINKVVFKAPAQKARDHVKKFNKKVNGETGPFQQHREKGTNHRQQQTKQPQPATKKVEKKNIGLEISGNDLMEMLLRASPTKGQDLNGLCQLSHRGSSVSGSAEYKEITDNLKLLLKVTA